VRIFQLAVACFEPKGVKDILTKGEGKIKKRKKNMGRRFHRQSLDDQEYSWVPKKNKSYLSLFFE